MSQQTNRPFGMWGSPISPLSLAQGKRLNEVAYDSDGRTAVWLEGRSDRGVLVASPHDDPAPRDLTTDLSVRAMVGYGGGDFDAGQGVVVFAANGRLYRQEIAGGAARPITAPLGAVSSPQISPDGRWVLFVRSDEGEDSLGVVAIDGESWPVKVAGGRDFYMQPRWHPSGRRIAWVAWDHPNMPWDGTELWLADFGAVPGQPRATNSRRLAGDRDTAIFQPEFAPDGSAVVYVSDAGGWGQLYLQALDGEGFRRLTPGDGEYGRPAWNQGQRGFAFAGSETLVCVRSDQGFHCLEAIAVGSGERRTLASADPYRSVEFVAGSPAEPKVAIIASGPAQPPRVIEIDVQRDAARTLARATGETVPATQLASARPVSWPSFDGETAHGLFYAPASDRFTSPGNPPLIVLVHGGPTSQVTARYEPNALFLATRGYAVLLVNYRGSTGYGRDYMLKLRGSWGIYDVEDSRTGCLYLAEQGLVDERKRVIMGGSAGGFTVLQSLVAYPGFYTAGVCMYGVSNQFTLASDTHKFEERYLDTMLGPLPEAAAVYRERSPIFHADRISDPIAVFQGDIDRVVPRAQSDEIVESLRRRGVPHEYHVYEGEGHGWRKTETIERFYTSVDRFLRQYVVFA
jgi:dipeptidyl aminopeptidase/acylaminoacyl peptidase